MAKLTTNLMSSDTGINVYCEEMGAHLRISTIAGATTCMFNIQVIDDKGDICEEFTTDSYPQYPDSVEVDVSYELTISAHRRITLEFESKEDYEAYKEDPESFIRDSDSLQLYSTSEAIDDADYYAIDDANITDVEEH